MTTEELSTWNAFLSLFGLLYPNASGFILTGEIV